MSAIPQRGTAKHAGRATRRYRKLKAEHRARCQQNQTPCWLCGQPIDYSLPRGHPDSFSTDHRYLRSTHPHLAEDPANFEASHLDCNKRRGDRAPRLSLGLRSRQW